MDTWPFVLIQPEGSDDDDVLYGNGGVDLLSGGADNDVIRYVSAGQLDGGTGLDVLDATSQGSWYVDMGSGATSRPGESILGIEILLPGGGSDTLVGSALSDWISGGGGADSLFGLGGDNRLKGNAGTDRLYSSGTGADTLLGGADDD